MKTVYVSDLHSGQPGSEVTLQGWVCSKRCQGQVVFMDVTDSTGKIQVVFEKHLVGATQFAQAQHTPVESAINLVGTLKQHGNNGTKEISTSRFYIVGPVTKKVSPSPRGHIDIFDEKMTDHLLSNRHLYLRNPKVMVILRVRDALMRHARNWFYENHFMSIDAPILTPVPLYEDDSAMGITIHGEKVFLTQCVGYYLEAAVHAFERVYNMGPSFRGEESRSKRHLMEYWHIKAEAAWTNLDDIMTQVESLITYVITKCEPELSLAGETLGTKPCTDGLNVPFHRITYEEALGILNKQGGSKLEFGKSLGSEEEIALSKIIGKPFWVMGIPRTVEPFPYVIDPTDARITRVADLIASNGYGELLGTAEKIHDMAMLEERMRDKGKASDPRYDFVRDVHQLGCVPHAAFGMGVERFVRWMLNIPHVRDAIPFPRIFRRKVSP